MVNDSKSFVITTWHLHIINVVILMTIIVAFVITCVTIIVAYTTM